MFDVTTIYLSTAALLGVVTVVFAARSVRLPASVRRYGVATVVAAGSMTLAYLGMAGEVLMVETTGGDQSVARFLAYTASWAGICYVIGAVAGVTRRLTLGLFGALTVAVWSALGGWLLEGPGELAATVTTLFSLAVVIALLYGPFDESSTTVGGARYLLFGKLKHLLLLGWAALVVVSVVSEQNLALVDTFVGQLVASYVDALLFVGFGGFVLANRDALEAAAGSYAGATRSREATDAQA